MARQISRKHVRETIKALRKEFPGRQVSTEMTNSGHVCYLINGKRAAIGGWSPSIGGEHSREYVVKQARRAMAGS